MATSRFERGAVVRCQDQTWIVWTYPRGKRYADPIALPVTVQNAPQHRSHVRIAGAPLGLPARMMAIRTHDAQTIAARDCVAVGQCSDRTIAVIGLTMRRASEARAHEQRHAVTESLGAD